MQEDVQINKYLQEFQVFRERSSRDTYKSLKKDISDKLKQQKEKSIHDHHKHQATNGGSYASLLFLSAQTATAASNQLLLPTITENGVNPLDVAGKKDGTFFFEYLHQI